MMRFSRPLLGFVAVASMGLGALVSALPAAALTPLPIPDPKAGSYGLAATKTQPAPTTGATITTPGNGSAFSTSPITVTGICPSGLLVQVSDNGVMVGAVMCTNGSFSLQIGLFPGTNELSANVYDEIYQTGPASNTVTVSYTDTHFNPFGAAMTLTSSYGRRSSSANSPLDWPLQLSGGAGPYAFSLDWGDGSAGELKSQPLAGLITTSHTYKKAGIYQVNVRVTDVNGVSAFLQLVAVANGKVDAASASSTGASTTNGQSQATKTIVLWIPAASALLLLPVTYWIGRRSQLISLRGKLMKERDQYEKERI